MIAHLECVNFRTLSRKQYAACARKAGPVLFSYSNVCFYCTGLWVQFHNDQYFPFLLEKCLMYNATPREMQWSV